MIESVDHALRLASLLQEEGPLRVTDVSNRLGVARSTAHRLLSMLVYRDFASQDSSRRYVAGPLMQRHVIPEPVAQLCEIALPHMQALSQLSGETVNMQILVGDHSRFVASVESNQVLRVGNRDGRMLPAHLSSGGRALLARRTEDEIEALYSSPAATPVDMDRLRRDMRQIRKRGYAINNQETEAGVTAIARAIRAANGAAVSALCIATPSVRFSPDRLADLSQMLSASVTHIERDLANAQESNSG